MIKQWLTSIKINKVPLGVLMFVTWMIFVVTINYYCVYLVHYPTDDKLLEKFTKTCEYTRDRYESMSQCVKSRWYEYQKNYGTHDLY